MPCHPLGPFLIADWVPVWVPVFGGDRARGAERIRLGTASTTRFRGVLDAVPPAVRLPIRGRRPGTRPATTVAPDRRPRAPHDAVLLAAQNLFDVA
jgi:hypothetical protein